MKVKCDYCGDPAELCKGDEVYPKRPDLYNKLFWQCKPCQARVGVHNGTTNPLGRLANAKLRCWKMRAHAAFDPLWKEKRMKRREAYAWLSKKMKMCGDECHIGKMDVEQCKNVVEVCS